MTTLRELLSTPFVTSVTAVQGPDGGWIRRAVAPELPGHTFDHESPWAAIDGLVDGTPAFIIDRLRRKVPVPVARPPLPWKDVESVLREVGLEAWIPYLDHDVDDLPESPGEPG